MSEPDRDPHLLAALRHAPDRDAAPPREVSQRILAAARAAVAPTAPAWKRWLDWVAQPQVAGAFGTLAIATVVGVMWATREPAPVSEPAAAATPPAAVEQDAARQAPVAQTTSAPLPAAEAPRATSVAKRDAVRRNEAPTPTEGRAVARLESTAPAPRADALAEKKAEAPSPAAPPPMSQGTAVGGTLADLAMTGRQRAAASAPTLAPLASARAAPQRQWWVAVQAATAGRWRQIERAPAAAPALTLELDSGAAVRLWFDGDAVVVADVEGRAWRAMVGAPTVREWQAELARW